MLIFFVWAYPLPHRTPIPLSQVEKISTLCPAPHSAETMRKTLVLKASFFTLRSANFPKLTLWNLRMSPLFLFFENFLGKFQNFPYNFKKNLKSAEDSKNAIKNKDFCGWFWAPEGRPKNGHCGI